MSPILPQRAVEARAEVESVDWLFEPRWPGERLMARCDGDGVTLTDEAGKPVEDASAAQFLAVGLTADRAVVEGVRGDRPLGRTGGAVFVAIDLVELDGESLTDVPFQERRRLLESVIDEGEGLRLSPIVKHPVAGWLAGWRESGFTHYLARHQNSRYLPGEENKDVLELPIRADAPHGIVAGVFGRRQRIKRIRD